MIVFLSVTKQLHNYVVKLNYHNRIKLTKTRPQSIVSLPTAIILTSTILRARDDQHSEHRNCFIRYGLTVEITEQVNDQGSLTY